MKLNPLSLTFDSDVAFQESDHIARIPANLTTKDALCAIFQQQLSVPAYFTEGNWDQLFDVLRFPNFELSPGASRNGRTILLHQDIPLLEQDRYEAKIYLEIVIKSILYLQQRAEEQANLGEQGSKEELIAVFPPQAYEEISTLLSEPLPWETEIGIHVDGPRSLSRQRAPDWSLIQQWIERLDGITVEYIGLSKDDCCSLYVTHARKLRGYYITYATLSEQTFFQEMLSSPIEQGVLTHLLSKTEVYQIVRYVYEQEQLPLTYQWYPLSILPQQFEDLALIWYYFDEEERFIETGNEGIRWEIYLGMLEMIEEGKGLLTLQEWQILLSRPDTTLDQRLTALCVLGRHNLRDIYDILLTSLDSPHMEERWVSARFLGLSHEQRALPILLAMLTENWEKDTHPDEDTWHSVWRHYAPRLLRVWQTPSVRDTLYQALRVWLEAEPHFDDGYSYWQKYEASLCYELGYRDAFALVLALPFTAPHHKFLLISMAEGYFIRSHHIGLQEETQYLIHSYSHRQAIKTDLVQILEAKCHFSKEQAQTLLDEYAESDFSFL